MAINPETQYPGKIAPADASYPYGSARNVTVPGDGTGTPWEAALVNDLFGFQQTVLADAAIVPSGTPETVTTSQYMNAFNTLFSRRFTTVANMEAFVRLKIGDIVHTSGYNSKGDGGANVYEIVAAATGTDDGGQYIDLPGSGLQAKGLFPGGVVTAEQWGVLGDGATDDKDELINFMAAPFRHKQLTGGKTYLTSSQLEMESNTILNMNGATLKAYDAGAGFENGYTAAVKTIIGWTNTTNSFVKNGHFDGNSAVFGGRTPDGNTGTYACLAWTGNTNVGAIDCTADDCSATCFAHLSNGVLGQSRNVFWVRCYANNSGLGFGQEILFAGGTGGLHGVSPGDTYYVQCEADDGCNFGLYIAGGEHFEVHGGRFANSRNDTLVLYTGDAQGVTRGRFYGGVIDGSERANSNKLVNANSVNIQPVNVDQYLNASIMDVEFHGTDFKGNPNFAQLVDIVRNCNIKFFGGNVRETKIVGSNAIAGAVDVTNHPIGILETGFEDCPSDYALASSIPVKCRGAKFSSVVSGVDRAILFNDRAADDSIVAECQFGSGRSGEQMQFAITTTVPIRAKVYGNNGSEMVGAQLILNSTTGNAANIEAYDNTPGDQFDGKKWRQVTAAPTVGTWREGTILWDKTPSPSGKMGWVCTSSGTFSAATDATGDTDGSTAVITGMTDTSDFNVGDFVTVSAGFPSTVTPYEILEKTATTITLDTNSNSAQVDVTVATVDPVFKTWGAIDA